jgi:hypothetical protein
MTVSFNCANVLISLAVWWVPNTHLIILYIFLDILNIVQNKV